METIPSTQSSNEDLQKRRTPCEIHTRVMGYYRPVSYFNKGKKAEFYSRKYFRFENESANQAFIKQFSTDKCEAVAA